MTSTATVFCHSRFDGIGLLVPRQHALLRDHFHCSLCVRSTNICTYVEADSSRSIVSVLRLTSTFFTSSFSVPRCILFLTLCNNYTDRLDGNPSEKDDGAVYSALQSHQMSDPSQVLILIHYLTTLLLHDDDTLAVAAGKQPQLHLSALLLEPCAISSTPISANVLCNSCVLSIYLIQTFHPIYMNK